LQAATNIVEGRYKFTQTWNEFELKAESRKDDEWKGEGDLFYRRWFDKYTSLIAGGSSVHEDTRGEIGVGYILPLLIESKLLVDHKGKLRVDLEKRFQWTGNIFTDVEYTWRQDTHLGDEFAATLMYAKNWNWAAGLRYTSYSVGAGFQYRF
ncbi:MAG: hypothetical protein H7326_09155, partial [Bdellovibrionaceae bacterium]|nr:hypothetical protein [Pseudobdellovibrionaceae bacterium]